MCMSISAEDTSFSKNMHTGEGADFNAVLKIVV